MFRKGIGHTVGPGKKDMTSESIFRPVQSVTFPYLQAFSPAEKEWERTARSLSIVEKTFWVVELEQDGTVLYSRPHIVEFGDQAVTVSEGLNFFEDITGLVDLGRCRQNFQSFVHARKAADSFIWELKRPSGTVKVKVIVTRTFQTGYNSSKGVVMIEMRECL